MSSALTRSTPPRSDPPRSALLLVAHGSRDRRHASTVRAVAERVRRQAGRPLRVEPAFLELSAPSLEHAVDNLAGDGVQEITIVPHLLGTAFHARRDLPARLCVAAVRHPGLTLRQTPVLGPSPLLEQALRQRVLEAGARISAPGTGVILGWSGSRDPAAIAAADRVAAALRSPVGPAIPVPATTAADSYPEAAARLRASGAHRIILARYLLAPGCLPDRLAEAADPGTTVTAVLGDAPEIAQLVLERYRLSTAAVHIAAGAAYRGK
jgi:sirohydrochlorin ferrochelatase